MSTLSEYYGLVSYVSPFPPSIHHVDANSLYTIQELPTTTAKS